jgi:hypothetical protein
MAEDAQKMRQLMRSSGFQYEVELETSCTDVEFPFYSVYWTPFATNANAPSVYHGKDYCKPEQWQEWEQKYNAVRYDIERKCVSSCSSISAEDVIARSIAEIEKQEGKAFAELQAEAEARNNSPITSEEWRTFTNAS